MTSRTRDPPPPPSVRLSVAVTGHRLDNPAFAGGVADVERAITDIFARLEALQAACPSPLEGAPAAPPRLHSLLADGVDQMAARIALARGWELVAPLPFGRRLNRAINARPQGVAEARALLGLGGKASAATSQRAGEIQALEARARVFELAERDAEIAELFLAHVAAPGDVAAAQAYAAHASERAATAGRVMIEQSDLLIGVWDGRSTRVIGGAGHTMTVALEYGAAVVWIDPRRPADWQVLTTPEALVVACAEAAPATDREAILEGVALDVLRPMEGRSLHGKRSDRDRLQAVLNQRWRPRSSPPWHAYRRVEVVFGATSLREAFRDLTTRYADPDAAGSQDPPIDAPPMADKDDGFAQAVDRQVRRRFAWADGVSSRLSDAYRGGMILNFLFSALAISSGVAYLPFPGARDTWLFAGAELALLAAIIGITLVGQALRWHDRWFETRRLAEYFRHAPALLLLGVARPPGQWPRGAETSWPEWYARHALRDVGLPRLAMTADDLFAVLSGPLYRHTTQQRDYHRLKAARLARAHSRLERLSNALFLLAMLAGAAYLGLHAAATLNIIPHATPDALSMLFTLLGVVLPTAGAAVAGVRYFGDFDRFAAISEVAAEKLAGLAARLDILLQAPVGALDYRQAAELAHAADDAVIREIESWQAVFGGKHITVPA